MAPEVSGEAARRGGVVMGCRALLLQCRIFAPQCRKNALEGLPTAATLSGANPGKASSLAGRGGQR
jgi:hypothetical protein